MRHRDASPTRREAVPAAPATRRAAACPPGFAYGLLAIVLAGSCADGGTGDRRRGVEGGAGEADGAPADAIVTAGTAYQRTIVYLETSGDSAVFAPWDFENRVGTDGVHRSFRGWLGRAGQWRLFMEDAWTTGLTRAPWRIVPRGPVRLVVGFGDALEEIYYREGVRDLSLRMGATIAEWSGQRGATYRLQEGTLRLADIETRGLVMDAFAVRSTDAGGITELGVLTAGDRLQLVFANLEGPGRYRAWARHDSGELFWPEVEMTWDETRSFERARRGVPVLWRMESSDGMLSGEFESRSSHVQALAGTGAILPVLAVYEVAGRISVGEEEVAVKGFLRHMQR